jgi:hypothetical protein
MSVNIFRFVQQVVRKTKDCQLCGEMIDEDEYYEYLDTCDLQSSPIRTLSTKRKKCRTCSPTFDENEYENYIDQCDAKPSRYPMVRKQIKTCPYIIKLFSMKTNSQIIWLNARMNYRHTEQKSVET